MQDVSIGVLKIPGKESGFLTAISKEEDYVFRGYQMGAVDYMSKPFQPDVLRAKVAVFVDLHLKQKRLAEQESKLRESERRMTELRHMKDLLGLGDSLRTATTEWRIVTETSGN